MRYCAVKMDVISTRSWTVCTVVSHAYLVRLLSARILYSALDKTDPAEEWLNLTKFFSKTGNIIAQAGRHDAALGYINQGLDAFDQAVKAGAPDHLSTPIVFSALCWKAESLWNLSRADEVKAVVARLRELLPVVPQETKFLAGLCYNLAVHLHNKVHYTGAAYWFQQALDVYKMAPDKPTDDIARTLRFLAATMVANNQHDQAAELAKQSLALDDSASTRYVLLKALVGLGDGDSARSIVLGLLDADIQPNIATAVIQVVSDGGPGLADLASAALARAVAKFPADPLVAAAQVTHLEKTLDGSTEPTPQATAIVEGLVEQHKDKVRVPPTVRPHLHAIIWNIAVGCRDRGATEQAVKWAEWASMFAPTDAPTRAKGLLLLADCLADTKAYDQALTRAEEAARIDFTVHSAYTVYRVLLLTDRPNAAVTALGRLQQAGGFEPGFLAVCAQDAYQLNVPAAAAAALEALAAVDAGAAVHVLPNLVKLAAVADPVDYGLLEKYLVMAYKAMADGGAKEKEDHEFYRRVAWNNAVDAQKAGAAPRAAALFVVCAELSTLDPDADSGEVLLARLRTLLMACGVIFSLDTDAAAQVDPGLADRAVAITRQTFDTAASSAPKRVSLSMVSTYHVAMFRSAMMAGPEAVSGAITSAATTRQDMAPCPVEVLALIANDCHAAGLHTQCVEACEALLARPAADTKFLVSRAVRMVVTSMVAAQASRAALIPVYKKALDVIKADSMHYIPIERYWVLSSCWNAGVDAHRIGDFSNSEQFFAVCVSLLDHVDQENCSEKVRAEIKRSYTGVLNMVDSDVTM